MDSLRFFLYRLYVKHHLIDYRTKLIYSNKKDASDLHGTVSFDPVKMSQQKMNQNVYQTPDTQQLVII